ncbi:MAG: diguanylate cyclase [Lachnospiraceae bacterium]|nr:diguanylate cyclase [Lachnospiraceae bacterium]
MKRIKGKRGIKKRLLTMVLYPILILGVLTIIIGVSLIYAFYSNSIHDELAATTKMMLNCLELTVRGDYQYEDGMLVKGEINITDSTMLYRIKEESQIDTTIFWQDERILTTMESDSGISAVGTKADEDVIGQVLEQGNPYFSRNVEVLGEKYIGYYTPMENGSHEIVGMIFAGKKKVSVYRDIGKIVIWFVAFSGIAVILATVVSVTYSNKMLLDIATINQYLRNIAEGDLGVTLDERIEERRDEIGEIGTYATKMRKNLQALVEMDPLTSLFNRRSCNRKLLSLMEQEDIFTVVMCDIDYFKKINDNYGHDAGDYVLKEISGILQSSVENQGFASRWGGEEFLLVYTMPVKEALTKVEDIQKQVRKFPFAYEDKKFKVTMTFGVQEREGELPYEQLIKEADNKLYVGKNDGRDRIVE